MVLSVMALYISSVNSVTMEGCIEICLEPNLICERNANAKAELVGGLMKYLTLRESELLELKTRLRGIYEPAGVTITVARFKLLNPNGRLFHVGHMARMISSSWSLAVPDKSCALAPHQIVDYAVHYFKSLKRRSVGPSVTHMMEVLQTCYEEWLSFDDSHRFISVEFFSGYIIRMINFMQHDMEFELDRYGTYVTDHWYSDRISTANPLVGRGIINKDTVDYVEVNYAPSESIKIGD